MKPRPGCIATAALLCAAAGAANAAPLTFNTALPISKDEWILREQFVYMKSTDDPSSMNRRMEVSGLMSVLGYGVSRDFAVFAVLWTTRKRPHPDGAQLWWYLVLASGARFVIEFWRINPPVAFGLCAAQRCSLLLVANSFLQYQPFMERAFGTCPVIAKNRKFKLYHTFSA